MTEMREVLLMSGSLRGKSSNASLLRTAEMLTPDGFRAVHYAGLAKLPHFNPDDDHDPLDAAVVDLRQRIEQAAALLICTPEYAGALPGSFKNVLDWTVGGVEIGAKPTAWINVSPSMTKAANAHASLRLVLNYTGAAIVEEAVQHLPVRPDMIDASGVIIDEDVRRGIAKTLNLLTAGALA